MLKPGGLLMLRFPNGQSPFGRYLQHADHTHRSTLSLPIIEQLTVSGPLTIVRHKPKKMAHARPPLYKIAVRIKSSLKVITELYLKKILRPQLRFRHERHRAAHQEDSLGIGFRPATLSFEMSGRLKLLATSPLPQSARCELAESPHRHRQLK